MEDVTPKLSRQDWLEIGLKTLIDKGIEAVRVEPLAKLLNVTRGSFYWHFKNRDDLLEAILQDWQTQKTESIIQEIDTGDDDPSTKLLRLFEVAAQDDDRLENAVRMWAAQDSRAAMAITQVDQRRLNYLQNLFVELGFKKSDATVRAQIAYSARLGWFALTPYKSSERLAGIRLIHVLLTQHLES